MCQVMEVYQPGAIVVCGGADSLSGDRLGCFNLSLQGHAHCMDFLAKFGVPMLVLGGGGYTMRNVARCWCYETGRMLAEELPDEYASHSPLAAGMPAVLGRVLVLSQTKRMLSKESIDPANALHSKVASLNSCKAHV